MQLQWGFLDAVGAKCCERGCALGNVRLLAGAAAFTSSARPCSRCVGAGASRRPVSRSAPAALTHTSAIAGRPRPIARRCTSTWCWNLCRRRCTASASTTTRRGSACRACTSSCTLTRCAARLPTSTPLAFVTAISSPRRALPPLPPPPPPLLAHPRRPQRRPGASRLACDSGAMESGWMRFGAAGWGEHTRVAP